jgi:hypothetical protein
MMRRACCCVQEGSGGADQPDQQLDCVLVSETSSAHERLTGGQIQTGRDCCNERVSAPAAPVPASRKDVSHPRRELLLSWLPNVEPFDLPDATHLLHVQEPRAIATGLTDLFERQSRAGHRSSPGS